MKYHSVHVKLLKYIVERQYLKKQAHIFLVLKNLFCVSLFCYNSIFKPHHLCTTISNIIIPNR